MRPAWQIELGRRWTEPHRHHHGIEHLREVLIALDLLTADGLAFDTALARRGAWFHDAIFDVTRDDNEEASAELARQLIGGPMGERVADLVMTTRDHVPGADPEAVALCDADLSVLGSRADRYGQFARGVRAEYAHVPEPVFRNERAAVLRRLLAHERVYASAEGRARWEDDARRNVQDEIRQLVPLASV